MIEERGRAHLAAARVSTQDKPSRNLRAATDLAFMTQNLGRSCRGSSRLSTIDCQVDDRSSLLHPAQNSSRLHLHLFFSLNELPFSAHKLPMRGAVVIALLVAACASDEEHAIDRKGCEQYRDHLVELRLHDASSTFDVQQHRAAMKQALGERFISSCEKQVSSSELRCALRASTSLEASACAKSTSE